jgi:hypothetical protein
MGLLKPAPLLLLFAIFLSASCRKAAVEPVTPSYLSLQFNGTSVKADTLNAIYSQSKNAMLITGRANDSVKVVLVINDDVQLGTSDILTGHASVIFSEGTNVYTATSGNIVVTSMDAKHITGTFQFKASDPAMINVNANTVESIATAAGTNGTFTTTYTKE